jgi:hypothetical protein
MNRWKFFALSAVAGFFLVSSDPAFTASSVVIPNPSKGSPVVVAQDNDGLRRTWRETEADIWVGTWTRRGLSNVFDAVWRDSRDQTKPMITGVVTITVSGNRAFVSRQTDNSAQRCNYEGTYWNSARNGISGTYTCTQNTGTYKGGANIEP